MFVRQKDLPYLFKKFLFGTWNKRKTLLINLMDISVEVHQEVKYSSIKCSVVYKKEMVYFCEQQSY